MRSFELGLGIEKKEVIYKGFYFMLDGEGQSRSKSKKIIIKLSTDVKNKYFVFFNTNGIKLSTIIAIPAT